MQSSAGRLASSQLLVNEMSRPVVNLFKRAVTVHPNTQVIIGNVVNRKRQARTESGLDLDIPPFVTDRIMVLRQPFVERQLIGQARHHLADITDKTTCLLYTSPSPRD